MTESEAGDPRRWLLVADLDDTLLGEPEEFRAFEAAVARAGLLWALNSSRPLGSVHEGLERDGLAPAPDAWIGAMGTEIEIGGEPLKAWTGRFSGFDRGTVDRVLETLGFEPHADEFQTPFKASFAVPSGHWEVARRALEAAGVEAQFLGSGESDFDVLPPGAGKGEATRFLAGYFDVDPDRLIVAGDSANDLAMFAVSRRGIVVGNARRELRAAVKKEHAYFAEGPRARGVLEGLRHFGAMEES